jgi:hypothetical protein
VQGNGKARSENNIRRVTAILSLLAGIVKTRAENGTERLTHGAVSTDVFY